LFSIKILVPRLYNVGGVANFYKTLRDYLSPEYEYVYRGNARKGETCLSMPRRMLNDYRLFRKILRERTRAVVINSSLGTGGFFRDGL
jgi:hypothetical protein